MSRPGSRLLLLTVVVAIALTAAAVAGAQTPAGTTGPSPASTPAASPAPQAPPSGPITLGPPTPVGTVEPGQSPTAPSALSHYAVLMDVASGKLLWYRNPYAHRSIASTTKILTAILLLEDGKPGDIVTAPPGVDKIEESSLHLKPGETIPLHDMLYAMLLRSANDTAVAGADYLCGSVPAFASLMNQKAREIGAIHSNFVTPNGLYDPNHYSTAADMALIARYAVLNLPQFNTIVRTRSFKVHRSIDKGDVWVTNTASRFLKEFPGADGIKTGYIHQSGHCFVGSATRDGWRLIAVALDSYKCREDVESILNYGFHNFQRVLVVHKGDPIGQVDVPGASQPVPVSAAADVITAASRWKPLPPFTLTLSPLVDMPAAPIAAGTKLGTFIVMAKGGIQASGDAVAAETVAAKPATVIQRAGRNVGHWFSRSIARGLAALLLASIIGGRYYARAVAKGVGRGRNRVSPHV